MSNNEQNSTAQKAPATSGLQQREPLVSETMDENPGGRPKGITQKTVKGPNGKKEFTIC
ncbi:MAG: hypothetical protein HW380_206 [Magnetococcales bacterium]|nr:hypothetical protein [Magnetococcales bacterium]HIJ84225.1 hypothetical protein [Magnetococcales bacterium]